MNREILRAFFIHASPEVIADALMRETDIQQWWANEARIRDGKGVLG